MELIADTTFKRMAPKAGFIAPYIQFPWGHERALIGKPVSIYKVDGGFFLAIENKQFTPSDSEQNNRGKNLSSVDEFKLNEIKNKSQIIKESLKGQRPGRNSNPSRLRDRQS